MGNAEMTDAMQKYLEAFEENATPSFEAGKTDVLVLYRDNCAVCHKEFDLFRKEMGFTVDGSKTKENDLASKIFPVEISTKFGMMLIGESRSWSKEMKNPDLEIKYTPSFLDAKTHHIIASGLQEKDFILNMLQDDVIKRSRDGFYDTVKMKGKKDCNAVACGMKDRVDEQRSKDAVALRKKNANSKK